MKARKLISAVLTLLIVLIFSETAFAASWEDFIDIPGHWAEKTVQKGFEDGLITGYDDSTLAPDAPITTAQMITILCRVLGAKDSADVSSLGISSDTWYADAAGKALNLGLISSDSGKLDAPMTRQNALALMAKAFCLVPAEPDYSALSSFSDSSSISANNKGAIAALVSKKLVTGFDGALNANSSITRAEFLTVLYRVAANYCTVDSLLSATTGGSVLKGSGTLNYITTDNIWFDCSSENVSLSGITANTVTLRSHTLSSFNLYGNNNISRFVVSVGKGKVLFGSNNNAKIDILQLSSCEGADIGSDVGSIEISGNGTTTDISGKHEYLIITGNNNAISLSEDVSIDRLKITGENNSITIKNNTNILSCNALEVSGKSNTLTINLASDKTSKIIISGVGNKLVSTLGNISSLDVSGTKAEIKIGFLAGVSGINVAGSENTIEVCSAIVSDRKTISTLSGTEAVSPDSIKTAAVTGNSNWLTLSCGDIASISISGKYNTVNKIGMGKTQNVELPGSENAFTLHEGSDVQTANIAGASNLVTINGAAQVITLGGNKTTLSGSGKVKSLAINAYGCTVKLTADSVTDNSSKSEIDRVLKLVTLGYNGNYTLQWALEHDYQKYEKEIWVNEKGYTSDTEYLIWVNLSMQRVNIFKRSAGKWEICHSCIVGTGAPGRGTPPGVWKTTYKSWAGWSTSTYTVKPVVGFKQNTGYAFHSRLYYPGTTTLSDSSIGYPVSHGCVRMYDADVKYIYDNIPLGTTVVVY